MIKTVRQLAEKMKENGALSEENFTLIGKLIEILEAKINGVKLKAKEEKKEGNNEVIEEDKMEEEADDQ